MERAGEGYPLYGSMSPSQQHVQQSVRIGRIKDVEGQHQLTSTCFSKRPKSRCVLLTLFVAFGVFGVVAGSVKYLFSLGTNGTSRTAALNSAIGRIAVTENRAQGLSFSDIHPRTSIGAASRTTTEECAGNTDLPVLKGVDVVAYFSIEEDQAAVMGSEEHASILNGYRFLFVSAENKRIFDESPLRYLPAWGGFCSWGIAMEDWWTATTLGPSADPNYWLISPDNVLHIFRSETPRSFFRANLEPNIVAGNFVWNFWFGDVLPGAHGKGSPMDTACLCDASICTDG